MLLAQFDVEHAVVFEREAEPLRVRRDRSRSEVDAFAGGDLDGAVLHEHVHTAL